MSDVIQKILVRLKNEKKSIQSTLPNKRTEQQRDGLTMLDCSINRINYEAQTQKWIFNRVSGI